MEQYKNKNSTNIGADSNPCNKIIVKSVDAAPATMALKQIDNLATPEHEQEDGVCDNGSSILNGVDYVTESVSGESIFLNLGIPFFGGEFLLGYRQDNSKFKNYQCQMSGKSVILAEPVNLVSGQINAGIGFLF